MKLPEPVELNPAANSVMGYTEAQLKQAVKDALEGAAKVCDAQVEGANRHVCKSKSRKADDIYSAVAQTAHTSRIEIRKLMEGILEEPRKAEEATAPDCRTCAFKYIDRQGDDYCSFACTNGDKYKPAPKLVLWRTQ